MDIPQYDAETIEGRYNIAFEPARLELMSFTDVQEKIDNILGEGVYVEMVGTLKFGEIYGSWNMLRTKARQVESKDEYKDLLQKLRGLAVDLKTHPHRHVRSLADYLFEQPH